MRGARFILPLIGILTVSSAPPAEEKVHTAIDLGERYDRRFLGADPEDELGVQARFADLNGDGFDEIVIGAWLADGFRNRKPRSGEVYIFFGEPIETEGKGTWDASVIYGASAGSRIGSAFDTGDFNGDGFPDLLIGARYAHGPEDSLKPRCGEVYLLLGGSDGSNRETFDPRFDADLTILGRYEGDRLGRRIEAADLDGDGKEDLLLAALGSNGIDGERPDAGAIYVLYGDRKKNLSGVIDLSLTDLAVLHGADESDGFGDAMAVGDWNNDGVTDLFFGCGFADGPANSRTNSGETFVLFGDGSRFDGERVVAEGTECTVYGAEPYDAAGVSITVGDFDGDGIDDLAIGAYLADGPENERENAGEVHLLFGNRSLRPGDVIDLALDTDFILYGAERGDQLGSIIRLFDWNGDGYADLIASSLLHDGPSGRRPDAGMVSVSLGGRAGGLRSRIDLMTDEPDLMMIGPTIQDKIATLLAGAFLAGRPTPVAGTMLGDGPKDGRRDGGEIYLLRWKPGERE